MKTLTNSEALPLTNCSAIVCDDTRRINNEVRAENGIAEKRLREVCQSEQRSRTSAIAEYGDPQEWDETETCIVCGGDEPCSHDFDAIGWPNAELTRPEAQ
jgi:hypothetical protein